jgi:hypothetical protein
LGYGHFSEDKKVLYLYGKNGRVRFPAGPGKLEYSGLGRVNGVSQYK